MLNATILTLVPLVITVLLIYAIFSIAIDVRAIRRSLERRNTRDNTGA